MTLETIVPKDGGITLICICAVLIPLTIISVILRIWSRRLIGRKLEMNDYLLVVGAALAVGNAILTILAVIYGGVGYAQDHVIHLYPTLAKITLALAIVWTLANAFVKLSILHLYLVIFRARIFRYGAYFASFLTIGYCVTNIVQNLLTCRPIEFNWDKTIQGGTCTTQQSPFLASAIINMSIDVIIFTLPLPMLWNLQMNTSKKISLLVIFGLGFIICIISAIRIRSIAKLDYSNFTQSVVSDGVYSVIEPCFGTINACLPILQPISARMATSRLFTKLLGTEKNASSSNLTTTKHPATIGGGVKKRKFHRIDEESLFSAFTDDNIPLATIRDEDFQDSHNRQKEHNQG